MNYKKYYSGYLTNEYDIDEKYKYKGKNFFITFEETNRCVNSSLGIYDPETNEHKTYSTKEVVLNTNSAQNALDISKLIFSSIALLFGSLSLLRSRPPEPVG